MVWAGLASQYARKGDMAQALTCIEQASVIAEAFNDPSMRRFVRSDRAGIHILGGDLVAAYRQFELLLTEWKERGGRAFNLADRINAGFVALLLTDSSSALEHLSAAEDTAQQAGVKGLVGLLLAAYLAATHATLDDLDAAERYEQQANELMDPKFSDSKRVEVTMMLAHVALARSRREHNEAHIQTARDALAGADHAGLQQDVHLVAEVLRRAIETAEG
jgi:tetratricopeptide (TPR) repeat protein